ncbi:MAG: AMP-binding protein [Symploca sp. SIO3E6]|nr:AMP-binding protein [Caldora sp. SIO3E6]
MSTSNSQFSNFVELLQQRATEQPTKTAYSFLQNGETLTKQLTYQELDERARTIALKLRSLCASGTRALLLYPQSLDFIEAFFGCLYAGVIAVPAYPPRRNQKLSRLLSLVNDAQATVALTTASTLDTIKSTWNHQSELEQLHWIATDILPTTTQDGISEALTPETLAFLQYTSGSTTVPKGVMVSHGNLINNCAVIKHGFQNLSIVVSWLPFYHDMGLIGGILEPLYSGSPMIFMSPVAFLQKPIRWLKAISHYRGTTSGGPNFAYDLCLRKIKPEQLGNLDLSSWEVAFNGAEPIKAQTLEQFSRTFAVCGFRRSAFYPCYGMAEATLLITGASMAAPPTTVSLEKTALEQNRVVARENQVTESRTLVSCGRSYLNHNVVIADPQSLTLCEEDQVGEIWVSGASVTSGYWQRPELTKETFGAYLADTGTGPFLRTGDLGFLLDGELYVTGRLKDVIIIRGRNHYPQDIELTVEQSHPALNSNSSAAFTVVVEGEEQLVVVAEVERRYNYRRQVQEQAKSESDLSRRQALDVDLIAAPIRQAVLEHHQLPICAISLLRTGSIPKTSSGKIQRSACRNSFLQGQLDIVGEWKLPLEETSDWSNGNSANGRQKVLNGTLAQELASTNGDLQPPLPILSIEALAQDPAVNQDEGFLASTLAVPYPGALSGESLVSNGNNPVDAIENWLKIWFNQKVKIKAQTISGDATFADYGIDSVMAVELVQDLEDWLQSPVETTIIWNLPNIKDFVQYVATQIVTKGAGDASSSLNYPRSQLNLAAEAVLDPDIYCTSTTELSPTAPQAIFLTGATGFLGAFLLAELLQQTPADIYCLVRAAEPKSGKTRIQENLVSYQLWQPHFQERIIPIIGDLSQPQLGLSWEQFHNLAEQVDSIYHNGALLNYVYPYELLKATNVLGTQEVLRLASLSHPKPVHYISSVAVFDYHTPALEQPLVDEFTSIDCTEGMYLGYSQSKWVADKLVQIAGERGLRVYIYRPSFIGGHSQAGTVNANDIIWRMIKGFIQMGYMPEIDMPLDITPIDYVSQSIVSLSRQNWYVNKVFHLNHPQPMPWQQLAEFIQERGYQVQLLSLEQWLEKLNLLVKPDSNHILYPLIPFLVNRWSTEKLTILELMQSRKSPHISCQETLNILSGLDHAIPCSPLDRHLWHTYFDYLINQSFFDIPQSAQKQMVR